MKRNPAMRLVAVTLTLLVAIGACSSAATPTAAPSETQFTGKLKEIVDRGELRVGVGIYSPFAVETPNGDFEGIDIEILTELGNELGVKTTFQNVSWDVLVAGVQTNKYDMTTAIVISDERKAAVDFSVPLYGVGLHWVVQSDNPANFQTLDDINKPGVSVLVFAGSFDETAARKWLPEADIKPVTISGGVAQAVAELMAGRTDVISLESPVNTRLYKSIHGDALRFIPPEDEPLQSDPVAYAVPKGETEFADFISSVITRLRDAGEIDKLFDKYAVPEFINQ